MSVIGSLRYQMLHPAVAPQRYNLSALSVDLELAEAVLESDQYEDFKGKQKTKIKKHKKH